MAGGAVIRPRGTGPDSGARFGMVTDKFGVARMGNISGSQA